LLPRRQKKKIFSIFDEIGTIEPEDLSFDKIIMGDILELTDEEQLEVYKAVIDLVKSKLDKAKSLVKNNIIVDGIDITTLKKTIIERVNREKK
jgi:hypothetical protein